MDGKQISEDAASWLIRLEEDSSAESRTQFKEWLEHAPAHMEEFLLMTAAYRELDGLDPARRLDVEKLIEEMQSAESVNVVALSTETPKHSAYTGQASTARRSRPTSWRGIRWAAAAGIVLTIVAAWQWVRYPDIQRFATAVGEQRAIKLEDGSVVQLNAGSRVEIEYSRRSREIRLQEGEALFVVEHDSTRPFWVKTDTATIQAVGTQFNVYRRKEGTTVGVVQGKVRVAPKQPTGVTEAEHTASGRPSKNGIALSAGEEARVTPGGRVIKLAHAEVDRTIAWRQRKLDFRGTTLGEVAREFNRYNRVKIQVADGPVQLKQLNGVFNADDPNALITFLESDPQVRIERRDDVVKIEPSR